MGEYEAGSERRNVSGGVGQVGECKWESECENTSWGVSGRVRE